MSIDLTNEATKDEVSDLKKQNARLKEMVADLVLCYDIVKKLVDDRLINQYKSNMILSASEKYEIIQQVTCSELAVKRKLDDFGVPRSTFY